MGPYSKSFKSYTLYLNIITKNVSAQFTRRLKDVGLGEKVRLKWIKQPDGKIFHLKETEEEKEKERREGKDTEEKSCIPKS